MGKRTLGDILLSQGRVTQAQIDDAIELQHTAPDRLRIGRILVQEGVIDENTLAAALAEAHDLRALDLSRVTVPLEVARLLPREVAMRHVTVPIRADVDSVIIAVADPVDVVALDDLRARLPGRQLQIAARIKIISGLDVFLRRVPQDGRTSLRLGGQKRDIRVSTLPTIHGEKVVLRLLPSFAELPRLSALGLTPDQVAVLREALSSTQGVILVTGPTGAGKSHTLYAALADTVDDQRNVITVEDPVEVEIAGITQVQVSESGVTFDTGLRAALRQDPDVLMVGEIRDTETGSMAARAALTGHLVLSTLHTNDAPSVIVRLMDLGIPRYLIGSSLSLVIAQRLLRRNCPTCAAPHRPDADVCARLGLAPGTVLTAGQGCPACDHTGFRGRVGCFEFMVVNDDVRRAITEGAGSAQVRAAARAAGWRPLQEQARDLALAGTTSPEEVLRATDAEPEDAPSPPAAPAPAETTDR